MGQKIFPQGIFEVFTDQRKRKLFTKSFLRPAKSHYGERIIKERGEAYREWDPKRSKLAAAIMRGAHNTGIRSGNWVLYLGASHGYTPSHVSDMIGKDGLMFAVEFAPQVLRDLVFMSYDRTNIAPILADANHPENYADRISKVDVVFQDIAQKNQAEIFIKNCDLFLKEGGFGLLSIKARSINIKQKSSVIFEEIRSVLEKKYVIADFRDLAPFEKDHCMIIIKNQRPTDSVTPKKKKKEKSFSKRSSFSKKTYNRESERKETYKKFERKPGQSLNTRSGKKFEKKRRR